MRLGRNSLSVSGSYWGKVACAALISSSVALAWAQSSSSQAGSESNNPATQKVLVQAQSAQARDLSPQLPAQARATTSAPLTYAAQEPVSAGTVASLGAVLIGLGILLMPRRKDPPAATEPDVSVRA